MRRLGHLDTHYTRETPGFPLIFRGFWTPQGFIARPARSIVARSLTSASRAHFA